MRASSAERYRGSLESGLESKKNSDYPKNKWLHSARKSLNIPFMCKRRLRHNPGRKVTGQKASRRLFLRFGATLLSGGSESMDH
jgi:hypothetical protein